MRENEIFQRFVTAFPPDPGTGFPEWSRQHTESVFGRDVPSYTAFMRHHARPRHGRGILRFLGTHGLRADEWNGASRWRTSWPGRDHLVVFATDWLARQHAFDMRGLATDEPTVAMLDPMDGAVLESDMTFAGFLETLAGPSGSDILSMPLYQEWLSAGNPAPAPGQSAGFKHPPVLGGKQSVENLELSDMDVYVTIMGQTNAQLASIRKK